MDPILQCVLFYGVCMVIFVIVLKFRSSGRLMTKTSSNAQGMPKSFSAVHDQARQPTGKQTCLAYVSGQYREEFWGDIYCLDGHPTDDALQEQAGFNNLTLQQWKYHADADWQPPGQLPEDMRRFSKTFQGHIQQTLSNLETQGWHKTDSTRNVRVAHIHAEFLTITYLSK